MRVLVWKKAPADRRSVTPRTRSSSQSRPWTSRRRQPVRDLGQAVVDRVEQAHQLGVGGRERRGQAVHRLLGPGRGDHRHEHLARLDALAHHHVAQHALLGALVVGADPLGVRPRAHRLAHAVAEGRREQAVLHVDHLVPAPAGVEAEVDAPVRAGRRRVLHLVAVAEALDRGVGLADVDALQVADPREVLRHLVALGREGPLVRDVLQAAAAAPRHVGARHLHPGGPGREHLLQVGLGEAAPRLADPHAGAVAGGGVAGEDHEAVVAGDAGPAEREVLDVDLQDVVAAGARGAGGRHGPSIAAWPRPPDLDEYRAEAEEHLRSPGPAADARHAGLFTADRVTALTARAARRRAASAEPRPLRRRGPPAPGERRARSRGSRRSCARRSPAA